MRCKHSWQAILIKVLNFKPIIICWHNSIIVNTIPSKSTRIYNSQLFSVSIKYCNSGTYLISKAINIPASFLVSPLGVKNLGYSKIRNVSAANITTTRGFPCSNHMLITTRNTTKHIFFNPSPII